MPRLEADLSEEEVTLQSPAQPVDFELKKYNAFMQALAILAFLNVILLGVQFWSQLSGATSLAHDQRLMLITSAVVLVAACVVGLFCAQAVFDAIGIFDDAHKWQAQNPVRKGRIVTGLFFAYLAALTLNVSLTGGSQSSPFASMILLNASFGYFMAHKAHIKMWVVGLSVAAFFLASVLYVADSNGVMALGFHGHPWPIVSYLVVGVVIYVSVDLEKRTSLGRQSAPPADPSDDVTDAS